MSIALQISIPFRRILTLFVQGHRSASLCMTLTVQPGKGGFYVNTACCGIMKAVYTTRKGGVCHRVGSAVVQNNLNASGTVMTTYIHQFILAF